MSGGYFDYKELYLDDIKHEFYENGGYEEIKKVNPNIAEIFVKLIDTTKQVIRDIDYHLSGDSELSSDYDKEIGKKLADICGSLGTCLIITKVKKAVPKIVVDDYLVDSIESQIDYENACRISKSIAEEAKSYEELTESELPQDLVKLQLKTLIEEDDCEEST